MSALIGELSALCAAITSRSATIDHDLPTVEGNQLSNQGRSQETLLTSAVLPRRHRFSFNRCTPAGEAKIDRFVRATILNCLGVWADYS